MSMAYEVEPTKSHCFQKTGVEKGEELKGILFSFFRGKIENRPRFYVVLIRLFFLIIYRQASAICKFDSFEITANPSYGFFED